MRLSERGLIFNFGLGFGFSQRAGTYEETDTVLFLVNEDFGGLRALTTDIKFGWGFSPTSMVFLTLKYSPPFIVSSYKSTYMGFGVSYSPKSAQSLILTAGGGLNKTGNKSGSLGDGYLKNIGIGYEFDSHMIVETNALFGEVEDYFSKSSSVKKKEFQINFTINYMIY
jgi:hypothetical protein